MDERDWLAERFQEHRPRLRAVAYRMLGSTSPRDRGAYWRPPPAMHQNYKRPQWAVICSELHYYYLVFNPDFWCKATSARKL